MEIHGTIEAGMGTHEPIDAHDAGARSVWDTWINLGMGWARMERSGRMDRSGNAMGIHVATGRRITMHVMVGTCVGDASSALETKWGRIDRSGFMMVSHGAIEGGGHSSL